MGHIIPMLDLTHLLLARGLTITIIVSTAELPLLEPLFDSYPASFHKLVLSSPVNIDPNYHPLLLKVLATQQLFGPIAEWFGSHPSPPAAIISDFFLGWTNELASHLGIPRDAFWPSGALASSIIQIVWRDAPQMNLENCDNDEDFLVCFPEVPNSPEFPWRQLTHVSRHYKKGDLVLDSFRKGILANMASWGIIYNSFEQLEGVYINYVKKQSIHGQVWAIGPLFPDDDGLVSSIGRGGSSAVPPDDLLRWLDKKPDDSVVYICFGSRAMLSENQMMALVAALELCKVHFILCAKTNDSSYIPIGFEERVVGRGFIVKGWAPQLAILRHRAVGSFVTHCGWNSTLEGVTAGVMMLAWPMGADQFTNAKLLVDQLGVGVRVCEGGAESVPDSTELARLLDESLSGDRLERVKVKELSQGALEAVKGGKSRKDLDMFVKCISEL